MNVIPYELLQVIFSYVPEFGLSVNKELHKAACTSEHSYYIDINRYFIICDLVDMLKNEDGVGKLVDEITNNCYSHVRITKAMKQCKLQIDKPGDEDIKHKEKYAKLTNSETDLYNAQFDYLIHSGWMKTKKCDMCIPLKNHFLKRAPNRKYIITCIYKSMGQFEPYQYIKHLYELNAVALASRVIHSCLPDELSQIVFSDTIIGDQVYTLNSTYIENFCKMTGHYHGHGIISARTHHSFVRKNLYIFSFIFALEKNIYKLENYIQAELLKNKIFMQVDKFIEVLVLCFPETTLYANICKTYKDVAVIGK